MSWLSEMLRGRSPKPLRGILGETYLDELGTAGGFALGGPAGAAAGRGAGKLLFTGDPLEGLQGAAEGYAIGTGAQALGLGGKGASAALGSGGGQSGAMSGADMLTSIRNSANEVANIGKGATRVIGNAPKFSPASTSFAQNAFQKAASLGGSALDYVKENPEVAFRAMESIGGAFDNSGSDDYYRHQVEKEKRQDEARREILAVIAAHRKTRDPGNPYLNMYR